MSYFEEYEEHIIEESIDDDGESVFFKSNDFISEPIKSERCTMDGNILQLHHSFGYDCCSKLFNICAADDHTIVYAAGSYINMLDINDGNLSFRKCAGNGGIGHIAKNPVMAHIAVGENCSNPLIIVYEWPTFEIVSVLKGCAKQQINWLSYSKNGDYLVSQAGEPDNTITIWDWKKSKIISRTKSHTQDVSVCRFSNFIPDHLVTAGSGHLKFWKMATTFTGLKLQGQLGRFGKTEISNVIGIFSMPDEKVISGCEWGNILVWDEELIDMEVTRKFREPCHTAPIIMFLYCEPDAMLTSISMDGTIKFWDYHMVDMADPPEKDRVLELEPSFMINVQDSLGDSKITGMCKIDNDPKTNDYFIQDGNGGMWFADIEMSPSAKPLRRLAKFHGGDITSLQPSPIGYFIGTTSLDGWFHVYDVVDKKLAFTHDFKVPITSSIWLPLKISKVGDVFIIGFQTGVLKMVTIPFKKIMEKQLLNNSEIVEIQSTKPHTSSIKLLTVNHSAKTLVCGSDDKTIFIYQLETKPIKLSPIGMFPLPGKVMFIHWKPSEKQTALISCASGHIVEVKIPTRRPLYTIESFLLKLESRVIKTVSIKSEILQRQYFLELELKKKDKMIRKMENLKIKKEQNPGVDYDEELCSESSEEDEQPQKLFIPSIPNPVLFAIYTPSENGIWVSIDGYDAGYLYEYDINTSKPVTNAHIKIPDKNNTPLTAIKIFGTDPLTIVMGFADGRIRLTKVKVNDVSYFGDYIEYSIHDNKTGRVNMLCFSEHNHLLYTCGNDCNIFSFMFQCPNTVIEKCIAANSKFNQLPVSVGEEIIKTKEDLILSLEDRKVQKKNRKALNLVNKEKDRTRCLLHVLREELKHVLARNELLPEQLKFSDEYFQLDERINNSMIEEERSKMDKLHLRLQFDYEKSLLGLKYVKNYFVDPILTNKFEVKAILREVRIKTLYHKHFENIFIRVVEEFISKKRPDRQKRGLTMKYEVAPTIISNVSETDIFLRNVRESYSSYPKKIQIAIDKLAARNDFENREILNIQKKHKSKPTDNYNIEEEALLDNTRNSIGCFNLRSRLNLDMIEYDKITMKDKFYQYQDVQDEAHNLKITFNEKVLDLRRRKIILLREYKQFKFDIHTIEKELNDPEIRTPSDFPVILMDESIDHSSIDSFEPISHWDPMDLFLNPEKSHLYKNELYIEPTYQEIVMQNMRKLKLKYRHMLLHETMLTKINIFDYHLLKLDKIQMNDKLQIKFLDLWATSIEEELLILNDFDLLEDEYLDNVYVKTGLQNDKAREIQIIQEEIKTLNDINTKRSNMLIDIQLNFDMKIKNSMFAKVLRKIFKKKLKIPKIKSDNDSLSSSSSDESDDSDEELNNESTESLTAMSQLPVFDDKVLPLGCDPKLYNTILELRSKRYEIEQIIIDNKKKLDITYTNLSLSNSELDIIENELKQNKNELRAYQVKKLMKLNDVKSTIVLNKSQMTNSRSLESCVLIYGNIMQDLSNRVVELKKEELDLISIINDEKSVAKQYRIEIPKMENVLKNFKIAIKDEMIEKFKTERKWSFLDKIEITIINYMITKYTSKAKDIKDQYIEELRILKNKISFQKESLIPLLRLNSLKLEHLTDVSGKITTIRQYLMDQNKINIKIQNLSKELSIATELTNIDNTHGKLLKLKQEICENIIKYK